MSKFILVILIFTIVISYTAMEKIIVKFFPKFIDNKLWSSPAYYIWGGLLLVILLIISPFDYILKVPNNNEIGLQYVLLYIISNVAFFSRKNIDNFGYIPIERKLEFTHICLVVPFCEEIAFRGLILPMSINLLGNNITLVTMINGLIFSAFHMSYVSFNKKSQFDFFMYFVHGYMLSSVAYRTGAIVYSVICHVINNTIINVCGNMRAKSKWRSL